MPFVQPGRADVHIDGPLTNISIALMQSADGFGADRVFPVIPVRHKSNKFWRIPSGAFNRDEMQRRAPATESAGGNYTHEEDDYIVREYAFHKDIPWSVRDNADPGINLDREAVEFVTMKNLIKREKLFVATAFGTGIWTSEFQGVDSATPGASEFTQWNRADSNPIVDVNTWRTMIRLGGGLRPNGMAIGVRVWEALKNHPDFVARVDAGQTTGPARVMRETIAALFELDEIVVLDAIENIAPEGKPEVNQFIGGDNVLLYYRPQTPGLLTPASGYTFEWTGRFGAGALSGVISRFPIRQINSDRVEIESAFVHKVIAPDLGFFALDAVAPAT